MNKKTSIVFFILLGSFRPLQAEILQLAAGGHQSAALVTGGDVFQWGEWGGPLPVAVFGAEHVKAIAVGSSHLLALRQDGGVWAWGDNKFGQLGNGTVISSDRPKAVIDLTGATAIAAGGNQSYALKNDGTVWAWGANNLGQLGDETTYDRRGPVVIEGLIDVVAIAAGEASLIALRKDGSICSIGMTPGTPELNCKSPYQSVAAVAAETRAGYVLLRDGTVRRIGPGHCGSTNPDDDYITDQVRVIAAGAAHLLLLKEDSTVWSCGTNIFGQLGDTTTTDHNRPTVVAGSLSGVTQIAAGTQHSLAVNESGVWAWGENTAGQLGNGNTNTLNLPTALWDGTGRLK